MAVAFSILTPAGRLGMCPSEKEKGRQRKKVKRKAGGWKRVGWGSHEAGERLFGVGGDGEAERPSV